MSSGRNTESSLCRPIRSSRSNRQICAGGVSAIETKRKLVSVFGLSPTNQALLQLPKVRDAPDERERFQAESARTGIRTLSVVGLENCAFAMLSRSLAQYLYGSRWQLVAQHNSCATLRSVGA